MTKPFDLKDLQERLKAAGLPAVEGLAEQLATVVLDWTKESCAIHENPLVKGLGVMAIETVRPMVMSEIDKIDGVQN